MSEHDRRVPLHVQLGAAARALQDEHPPADLPARIRARLPAPPAPARARAWPQPRWAFAGLGTACAALLVALMLFGAEPVTTDTDLWSQGFVPVAGSDRWQQAAESGAWLVSTELPRSRLAALGLPYDPTRAAETVRAQFLMHSSGDVLAVRLIDGGPTR
jgi:hypothetical protein